MAIPQFRPPNLSVLVPPFLLPCRNGGHQPTGPAGPARRRVQVRGRTRVPVYSRKCPRQKKEGEGICSIFQKTRPPEEITVLPAALSEAVRHGRPNVHQETRPPEEFKGRDNEPKARSRGWPSGRLIHHPSRISTCVSACSTESRGHLPCSAKSPEHEPSSPITRPLSPRWTLHAGAGDPVDRSTNASFHEGQRLSDNRAPRSFRNDPGRCDGRACLLESCAR